MSNRCPLCSQPLPEAIDQNELQARIQKLTTPALAVERRRLKEEFESQLVAEREMARQKAERHFQQQLRAAEKRAKDADEQKQKDVERARKEVESRLEKEVAQTVRLATRENEVKLAKLQADREKERVRYEGELAKFQGKLEDLSRKLEKQSGEQLGSEAELDLFTELKQAFPQDRIERIGKGVKGADIVHEVMDGTKVAGRIVYESKNTSSWQNGFIAQAKKYQTQYETPHVMVVTRVFPSKNKGLCTVRDIPVVERRMAVALAMVIREGVVQIAKLRLGGKFRDEKSRELFEYIVGDKFCTRFREMAEGVASLREQQQKERTWHENAWQAESKIHECIEGRHREVAAQIMAIVRGSDAGETVKLVSRSETWRRAVDGVHEMERAQ